MPSVYISEAELIALAFCSDHTSSDIEASTDREWAIEAERHVDAVRSLAQKAKKARSEQALKKALKERYRQK